MTYGLQLWGPSGALLFDSSAHAGGALIDRLVIPNTSVSGSKYYSAPYLAGRSLFFIQEEGGAHDVTTTEVSGYPRVNWTRLGTDYPHTILWVYAR